MLTQDDAENKILQSAKVEISPQTQEKLNKPLEHPHGLDEKDQQFLALLMDKIEKKEINLYRPSSLLNDSVYGKMKEQDKAKAELDALNMLNTIREIHRLWQAGNRGTYQIENLVHRVRVTKERLEEAGGDIFII